MRRLQELVGPDLVEREKNIESERERERERAIVYMCVCGSKWENAIVAMVIVKVREKE